MKSAVQLVCHAVAYFTSKKPVLFWLTHIIPEHLEHFDPLGSKPEKNSSLYLT